MSSASYSKDNLHDSNWQTLVNKGLIMYSPTYDTNSKTCERKAVLNSMDSDSHIHFDYGHAFGASASVLFKQHHEPLEIRLGKAILTAAPFTKRFWDLETHYSNKTMYRLLEGLLDVDIHAQDLMRSHTVYGEEEKVILRVFKDDNLLHGNGFPYYMGGTYDIALRTNGTNKVNIHDFKAINSQFMYSFVSDMQIPFYSVVNQLKNIHMVAMEESAEKIEFHANNNYLVHQTGNRAENFERKPLLPQAIANGLVNHMKYAMKTAKKLTSLGKSSNLYADIDNEVTNYHQCSRGKMDCMYRQQCQTTPPEYTAKPKLADDRRPSSTVTLEVTEQEILDVAKLIAGRAVARIEDIENFTTMSLEDLNNSVVSPELNSVGADIDALFEAL